MLVSCILQILWCAPAQTRPADRGERHGQHQPRVVLHAYLAIGIGDLEIEHELTPGMTLEISRGGDFGQILPATLRRCTSATVQGIEVGRLNEQFTVTHVLRPRCAAAKASSPQYNAASGSSRMSSGARR